MRGVQHGKTTQHSRGRERTAASKRAQEAVLAEVHADSCLFAASALAQGNAEALAQLCARLCDAHTPGADPTDFFSFYPFKGLTLVALSAHAPAALAMGTRALIGEPIPGGVGELRLFSRLRNRTYDVLLSGLGPHARATDVREAVGRRVDAVLECSARAGRGGCFFVCCSSAAEQEAVIERLRGCSVGLERMVPIPAHAGGESHGETRPESRDADHNVPHSEAREQQALAAQVKEMGDQICALLKQLEALLSRIEPQGLDSASTVHAGTKVLSARKAVPNVGTSVAAKAPPPSAKAPTAAPKAPEASQKVAGPAKQANTPALKGGWLLGQANNPAKSKPKSAKEKRENQGVAESDRALKRHESQSEEHLDGESF